MKGPSIYDMVETVLKEDEEAEMDKMHKEEVAATAKPEFEEKREGWNEELRAELKEVLRKELRVELIEELKAMKKEEEFQPGFLPRPNDHTVYALGEDDYAFWDLLFGKGRKKERERWRSLKARMEDFG